LLLVASVYKEWADHGGGLGNYLAYGDFPMTSSNGSDDSDDLFLPQGIILDKELSVVHRVDQQKITGYVMHSRFKHDGDNASGYSSDEQTGPKYTGPELPCESLEISQGHWIKAPRYDDTPMEVGPLARMLIAYARGHERVKFWVDAFLTKLEAGPEVLFSTLGRTVARGIETAVLAEKVGDWVDELAASVGQGDSRIHESRYWDPQTWPEETMGWGWTEAPRGALCHWVRIKSGKIANYRCIVPSAWNASPRDTKGQRGAYEAALLGTPVHDPRQPIEILRTIHSFDPCMPCAVHVTDPGPPRDRARRRRVGGAR
jgi:Ni,Fe-hydrogenase I large subunit